MNTLKNTLHDSNNGLDYTLVNDHYLPNLTAAAPAEQHPTGRWGREKPEQLLVADFLAAELGDVTGDNIGRALDALLLPGEFSLLLDLGHIVAIEHVEAAGLLQMGDQDCLGLAAQSVDTVREDAAHEVRAVVELSDGDQAALTVIGRACRRDFLHFHRA